MYYLSIEGAYKYAEYQKSNDSALFQRIAFEPNGEDGMNECLDVCIYNDENKNNLRVNWVVLHGTPRDIVQFICDYMPMAKLEHDRIFNFLDTVGAEDVVTFTYLMAEPYHVVENSPMFQELRKCQQYVVADFLELPSEQVKVL